MYYLYEHSTLDNVPFYIGKGTKTPKKAYGGYPRAYSRQQRTRDWAKIANEGYNVKIIQESENLDYILDQEDKLWANCKNCVNKQTNKKLGNQKVRKINDTLGILYVFNKTYIILNTGEVYNFLGEKLNLSTHSSGYIILTVSEGSRKKKNFYVHRLVAELFIDNPENYTVVNHIDLNRKNNNATNLQWCTQQQNITHSVNLNSYTFKDRIKKVLQFDKKGSFVKEWDRASDAAKYLGCVEALIQQACQQKNINKTLTGRGFIWIYKADYDNNIRDKFNKTVNK